MNATTIGGDLSVDGGTFFYDAGQDSLGLGTQNPDQRLHIYEGSNNLAIVHLENQEGEVYWRTDGDVEISYYGGTNFQFMNNNGSKVELRLKIPTHWSICNWTVRLDRMVII